MKIKKGQIGGIKFYYREGTSDIKTFEEVIGRNVYEKRGNKINKGEFWYDFGGNVGAFALLAKAKGAEVQIVEPDPFNCDMIESNLKLNGFKAEVHQKAVVHRNDLKSVTLFVGNNNQYWRNSIIKNWNGKGIKVDCIYFEEFTQDGRCAKMDIEGAEMAILETTKRKFKKLVFEWSFDIDPCLKRYWRVLDKMENSYKIKCSRYDKTGYETYQTNWFPMCENVFCYEKN